MKLPKLTDLDPEQVDVFDAPFTGCTMIIGPPGSGKTVLAFFRAAALKKLSRYCNIVMHNKVLSKYADRSSIPDIGPSDRTQTMYMWLKGWWLRGTGKQLPRLPTRIGSNFRSVDYREMTNIAAALVWRDDLNWGHLVIDEGQDFPRTFYDLLSYCRRVCFANLTPDASPALTILADENQRITEENSTIDDIRNSTTPDRVLYLRRNYRNTRQIASFANQFYVGLESGTTELPEREGELPRVVRVPSSEQVIDLIVRHVLRNDNEEVAVLLPTQELNRKYYGNLKGRLAQYKRLLVQSYVSGDEKLRADQLKFDRPGSVTVLCHSSVKGLEFDTVFIPELHTIKREAGREEITKMSLYVMCSRARRTLRLFYEGNEHFFESGVGRWLPNGNADLAVWE